MLRIAQHTGVNRLIASSSCLRGAQVNPPRASDRSSQAHPPNTLPCTYILRTSTRERGPPAPWYRNPGSRRRGFGSLGRRGPGKFREPSRQVLSLPFLMPKPMTHAAMVIVRASRCTSGPGRVSGSPARRQKPPRARLLLSKPWCSFSRRPWVLAAGRSGRKLWAKGGWAWVSGRLRVRVFYLRREGTAAGTAPISILWLDASRPAMWKGCMGMGEVPRRLNIEARVVERVGIASGRASE